jgi:hypothetical protein
MSSHPNQTTGETGDGESTIPGVLASEKERTTTLERTSDGKNAHIVANGDTLCSQNVCLITTVEDELPRHGLCDKCQRRLKYTKVTTAEEVVELLPEDAEIGTADLVDS